MTISPAYQALRAAIYDRVKAGNGMYGKATKQAIEMYAMALENHLNPKARMGYEQAYQVASVIVVRIDAAFHDRESPFTGIETIQIATFINTCNPDE